MALQISTTTQHGLDAPTAYARISSFNGDKSVIALSVTTHATAAARQAGLPSIREQAYQFDLPETVEGTLMSVMYGYLKALPDFSGAIDV